MEITHRLGGAKRVVDKENHDRRASKLHRRATLDACDARAALRRAAAEPEPEPDPPAAPRAVAPLGRRLTLPPHVLRHEW